MFLEKRPNEILAIWLNFGYRITGLLRDFVCVHCGSVDNLEKH